MLCGFTSSTLFTHTHGDLRYTAFTHSSFIICLKSNGNLRPCMEQITKDSIVGLCYSVVFFLSYIQRDVYKKRRHSLFTRLSHVTSPHNAVKNVPGMFCFFNRLCHETMTVCAIGFACLVVGLLQGCFCGVVSKVLFSLFGQHEGTTAPPLTLLAYTLA
jgi:hypothetical protein